MKKKEKEHTILKRVIVMLLVVSLLLSTLPASVLAAGGERLQAAVKTLEENAAPEPEVIPEPQEEPDTTELETTEPETAEPEPAQPTPEAQAKEADAAAQQDKAAEAKAPEADPAPKGEIMSVSNALTVAESPQTQDAEIGESVVLAAKIEAQNPDGVTYQWQCKEGGDLGIEVQSTDEALEKKQNDLAMAESIDLTGITGDESEEAAKAVQEKENAIREAKTRPIQPDNEGWSDIPGANDTQLAVTLDSETAGAPMSYRLVACTADAAIATPAAMVRTNSDFAGGTGTERDPYIIATHQQLWNLHKYEGTASKGKYWRLKPAQGKDLSTDRIPIGKQGQPFMGTLDGDGYTIEGEDPGTNDMYDTAYVPIPGYNKNGKEITAYGCALFGFLKDATIVNLNVRRISSGNVSVGKVSGTNVSIAAGAQLAAAGENTTIENCYTEGNSIYNNKFLDGEYTLPFLWIKEQINVYRYMLGGGIVACGEVGDGYSVRFTGTIANSHTIPWLSCMGGNIFRSFTSTGTIHPNTSLDQKYRPRLVNVYSSKGPLDFFDQDKITPGSTRIDAYGWNPVTDQFNDYVVKGDKLLNYWSNRGIHPEINTRGVLDFTVSDYIKTYDGSVQKAIINCAWKETQRGRDWDYSYKKDNGQGETVDEDSVKLPGTYLIAFEEKNRDYHLGKVSSWLPDWAANPDNARLIVNPIADKTAPVCGVVTYTDEEGGSYQPNTWTDKDVTVTFNIDDFTKGGNYNTVCDKTPYTVDQEGNEVSGIGDKGVVIKDANGTVQNYTKDGNNYTVTLKVDEGKQLTTTLVVTMTDKKGNTSMQTTEPIKINKSAIKIEVTGQKDNDEQATILSGGSADAGYSFFAKNRIRFDVKAEMDDNSLYVDSIRYKFVPVGAVADTVKWETTDFTDHQNPHSINMTLENTFDGTLHINATSVNGKSVDVSYKVMLEKHQPSIISIAYIGYKGQGEGGSADSQPATAYKNNEIYHKADLNISYEDPEAEKSGIAKAQVYRADNNELLAEKVISDTPGGQGPVQDTVTLTCGQTGNYPVKVLLTDKAGNEIAQTSDTLNIEAAAPAVDVTWTAPVDGNKFGFDSWCDQNATVTLSTTNSTDIANKVDYYYRRAKRDTVIDSEPWVKINAQPLSPTETLDYTVTDDGKWRYQFKATTQANICGNAMDKNIYIDRSPLDTVTLAPQDVSTTDNTDVQTEPNGSGWYTDADRALQVQMSLANSGESKITGHYTLTYQPTEIAKPEEIKLVKEDKFSTEVGKAATSITVPCKTGDNKAEDGVYTFTVYTDTESGRGSVKKVYTYKVDRTLPILNPSWFVDKENSRQKLAGWTDQPTSTTGTHYLFYKNQPGRLEIDAEDNTAGLDKIEYQICNDITQQDTPADGVWQVYDADNMPVFSPRFSGNVFIRVTDKAGHVLDPASGKDYTHSSSFYLDDQKPQAEVTADKDLTKWQTGVSFDVRVKDAESGIKLIALKADNEANVLATEIADMTEDKWKTLGIENFKATQEPSGIYSEISFTYHSDTPSVDKGTPKTLTLDVTDNSGNTAAQIEREYKIDTVAPVVSAAYTDSRENGKWYNQAPGFKIENTKQAVNAADEGKTHTLSGVRYYYKTWKSGDVEPTDWTTINDTPTDKSVVYTYPDEAKASVRFRVVSETGKEALSSVMTVQVDGTNPADPAVAVKNKAGNQTPDGQNSWYKGAWPTINITDPSTTDQQAPESVFYKLYTGADGSKAQTATKGQSILNSSFVKNATSPKEGIVKDQNNGKDKVEDKAAAAPADPTVMAEGARTYEEPEKKQSNKLVKSTINVLNLYPQGKGSDGQPNPADTTGKVLINWMIDLAGAVKDPSKMQITKGIKDESYLEFTVKADNDEVIKMTITQKSITEFNASQDPEAMLKKDGSYYDLIYLGAMDANGSQDIADKTLGPIQNYMNAGNGFLVGHDAFSFQARNIVKAMESLANITPGWTWTNDEKIYKQDPDIYTPKDKSYERSTSAKIVKSGKITSFPFKVGNLHDVIPVEQTHDIYQFAKGDVWLQFSDGTDVKPYGVKTFKGETGTSNYYLTTSGNVGMSQVGHTNGKATDEEKKLLVNTMVTLAQKPTSQFVTENGEPQEVTAIIRTKEQLGKIGTSGYPLNGLYVLGDNITIDSSFTPIEDFRGSFDGGNYTITSSDGRGALFANTTTEARIMNFKLDNCQLVSSTNAGQITNCASKNASKPLIGAANSGNIAYCSVIGTSLSQCGIVPTNTGVIQDCKVTGDITASSDGSNQIQIGGIAATSSGSIQNCEYNGDIAINSNGLQAGFVGGIAGESTGSLSRCKTSGSITISGGGSFSSAGGIVGNYSQKSLADCQSSMNIDTAGTHDVGGIVGYLTGKGSLSSCENTGIVDATENTGGIVGVLDGDTSLRNAINTGKVVSGGTAGGLAGTNRGSISDSKTSGAVEGGTGAKGGAVGLNDGGSIVSCYADPTGITPKADAAGFVGSHENGGTINTCATTANSFVGTNYNSSANPKITADGVYTLETWVKDEATDINAQNQNTSGTVKNTIMVDTHGPAPFTATVENNVFTTLLNTLTFGLLFDKTTDVVLEASDDVSGMDSIEYSVYATTDKNTNPETDTSTPVETKRVSGKDKVTFSITPNFQGYVRATATDKAGNTTELSTDGFRINSTLPRVKATAKKGNLDYNGDWSKDALTVTLEYVNKEGSNDLAGDFKNYEYSIDNGQNWKKIGTTGETGAYFTAAAVSGTTQTLTFSQTTSQNFIFRAAITGRTDGKTASETTAVNIKIDKTEPTVTGPTLTGAPVTTNSSGYAIYGAQPTLTATANDPEVSGLMDGTPSSQFASGLKSQQYKLQSSDTKLKDYTGPLAMKDGKYEFSFTATDNAGNEASTTEKKFIVDTMVPNAPETEAKAGAVIYNGSWTADSVTITAKTKDTITPLSGYNGNGIQYALYKDGELKQDWKDYNGTSVTIEALENGSNDGSWSVCFKVVTNAGHESAQSVVNVNIQKTAPTISVGVNGTCSKGTNAQPAWTNQPVTLEAATNGSTLYQKIGNTNYVECKDTNNKSTTHQTLTVNTEGVTTYQFKGESKSKLEKQSDVYKIALDKTAPDMPAMSFTQGSNKVTLDAKTSSQWYQDNERNTLEITDLTSDTGDYSPRTLKYRVYKNDATVVPDYTKATGTTANINDTNITESGTWILEAYTEDAAGNASAVNRQVFNYTKSDNVPTITIGYDKQKVTELSDTPVYKGAVTATITATDDLVGIKKDSLKFKLEPDEGTKLQYGTLTRYTGPVEIENFKGTITVEVTNNANQTAMLTQRICADSQKPSVSIRDAGNKKERQWQKESFSLQVSGGEDTKSGFAKYQYYDTTSKTWVDFTESHRINDNLDYLWNNVKYDVTQNGKTLVRVRAVNNAGIEGDEATFEVWKDDTTAPITIQVKSDLVGDRNWSKKVEFTPSIQGTMPPSGVDYYYRASDTDPWRKLTGASLAIRQTTPGAGQAYTFKAVSGTGNESAFVAATAYIDGEKPKAPQLSRSLETPDGDNGWYVTSPEIIITEAAKDAGQSTTGLDIDDELRSKVQTEYQLTAPQAQTANQKSWLRSRAADTATQTWQQGDKITFTGDGSFDFMTRSRDAADNLSDLTKKETIKIDTANPTLEGSDITVSRVSDGGLLTKILYNDTVEVTAKAADVGSGVNQITYQLGDDETTKKTLTADGNGSVSFRLSPKQGTPLNTSLKLIATDLAGRGSAPVTVDNILLEVEKPEAAVSTTATPNAQGWYKGELPYTVEVSDKDAGLQSVKVTANQNGTKTVIADENIDETDSKATRQYKGTLTASGNAQTVTIAATDRAGNTQTIEKPFKLETKAPDLGVSFSLVDSGSTAYSGATSYDVQAQLSYDAPVSGVEDLQVSADNGKTWSSVSDALDKTHKITTETNAEYRFRLVTNAGNVSNETAPQRIVISRKMPDPASIEVKDKNGQIMSGTWSNQDQTATISLPACSDAGVQAATEYQYRTLKDNTEDAGRTGSEAPQGTAQQIALADFTEEGSYTIKTWGQQKDSGLKDEANLCEAQVLVDKTPPLADKSNVNAAMDNGLLKANVYVFDSLSGGGSVDYTLTRSGVESSVQNASCSQTGEASIDIGDLAPGDKLTITKLYDKAGNSADMTAKNVVEIPDTIDLTKITVGITPQETTEQDWYHGAALSALADINIEGGTKPEDIKDDAGNVVKTYPADNSLTKLEVTYPDNSVAILDYTQPDNSGKTEEQRLLDNITGEGKNLSFKVKAYDAWDNSAEAEWIYQNDATPPDKPEFKLTTSDGEVGTDGKTDKEVTLTVSPDTQNENPDDPDKIQTSPLRDWQYSLDGGTSWSEAYPITDQPQSLSRVIAGKGFMDTDAIVVRVTDLAGNIGANSDAKSLHVTDTQAPVDLGITETDGTSPVDSAWDCRKADRVLKVHATDPADGVISLGLKEWNYSLDNGNTWQAANIPWDETGENNITIVDDGIYNVIFKVWDKAGNESVLDKAAVVKKDLTAPVIEEQKILFEQKKGADNWIKAAIHWLSFGNFFNDSIRVTVPVTDALSGNHSLSYSVGDTTTEVVVNDGKAVFTIPVNAAKDQTLQVSAKDVAGNVSSTLPFTGEGNTAQWTVENSGPMIADSVVLEDANAAGWYSEDVHVSVAVEDADSGLAAITWQLNDEPEQTVMPSENGRKDKETIEVTVTKDGVNTIRVTATDNAGNSETREYSFKLDHGMELQAYITETTGEPVDADRWRGGDTVSLKANMAAGQSGIATWEYTLDGGQTWTDPRAWGDENILEIKEDGVYCQSVDRQVVGNLIGIRVTDVAGNQTESPYESIKKDNEAPAFAAVYMDEANGNTHETVRWHKEGKPSVRLVPEMEPAEKAPVTHTCVLNDEPVVFDSEAELREMLREGENILRVYAKDAAGNEAKEGDQNYIERVLYIDTEMPEIGEVSFKDSGNNPLEKLIHWLSFGNFFNEAVQVTVPVTDTTSGCETLYYSLDGQTREISVKDDRASFEIPMDTNASLSCYAKDIAGNRSKTLSIGKESGRWVITDKIEIPDLWINGEAALGQWYNQPVSYELLVSCPEAGINSIEQTIDKGEPVILQEALFLESLIPEYRVTGELGDDGIHQLQHSITDHAGNQTQREDIIKIDQTAPKGLKITGAPQNGEILEPQTLTVWADDSIEGIDTSGLKEWSYTLDGGKTWTAPQLWNQNGQNDITVKDARAYDISFKVWDHAGNVSELSATESVRFTIASDNSFNVVNPVTGLYFTTVQLMGLAGCLIAVLATLLLSLAWRRKNRQK
ncbi:MAG: Ig-like domain repeat protein [Eubacterium limosum]|nr:Ig-like domain repeat protein [Eubacterium limosum]